MKLQKFSVFPVANGNRQNKPCSCDIKEYEISLTLIGALVVVGMFVAPI